MELKRGVTAACLALNVLQRHLGPSPAAWQPLACQRHRFHSSAAKRNVSEDISFSCCCRKEGTALASIGAASIEPGETRSLPKGLVDLRPPR